MSKQSLKRGKFPFKSKLNLLSVNWWKIAVTFWKLIGIVASIGIVGLLVWIVVRDWQGLQVNPNENSKLKLDGSLSIVTTGATIVTGLFLVLNYTAVQGKNKIDADFAEKRLTMERFTKAVEMLGNSNIHVRLGGIYSLESIARDSDPGKPDDDYQQVFEVLTAFIRENSPYLPKTEQNQATSNYSVQREETTEESVVKNELEPILSLPTDIQAILTVITRRKHKDTDWKDLKLDLSRSNLRGANLAEANLQAADLSWANLQNAFLREANLQEANLREANLKAADLSWANLQNAFLPRANLQNAFLTEANLRNTFFVEANLQNAFLGESDLQKAKLSKVNLQGAILTEANLQGAILTEANLQEAILTEANLQGAILAEADLLGANLSKVNLQKAKFWYPGFKESDLLQAKEKAIAMIVSARHWEEAKYDPEINELLVIAPKNANSEQPNTGTVLYRDCRLPR